MLLQAYHLLIPVSLWNLKITRKDIEDKSVFITKKKESKSINFKKSWESFFSTSLRCHSYIPYSTSKPQSMPKKKTEFGSCTFTIFRNPKSIKKKRKNYHLQDILDKFLSTSPIYISWSLFDSRNTEQSDRVNRVGNLAHKPSPRTQKTRKTRKIKNNHHLKGYIAEVSWVGLRHIPLQNQP